MQNQKLNISEIEEDILLVGGGPVGNFIAHVLSTKYGYTVRIIERYPDITDPNVQFRERSGIISIQYRTEKVFQKYGLLQDLRGIVVPVDTFTLLMGDQQIKFPWLNNKRVFYHGLSRRDVTSLVQLKNKNNSKIIYEFNTKAMDVDIKNNTFETINRDTNERKVRKFKVVFGADGYRSFVRQGIDRQIIKDRKLDENTELTRLEEFPLFVKNLYVPNYERYCQLQEEIKQGKYPLYEKLDEKFRNGKNRKANGKCILDNSTLYGYGYQNLMYLNNPMVNGQGNIVMAIFKNQENMDIYLKNHPEYQNSIRFNKEVKIFHDDLKTDEQIHQFLEKHLPFLYGLTPDMIEQWKDEPLYSSNTVFCDNWYYDGDAILFGDACEGMGNGSANGYNVSMENVGRFFEIFDQHIQQGEQQKFLKDRSLRKVIFQQYQDENLDQTRTVQIGDLKDCVFPGLSYSQHPKYPLYSAVEQVLYKECEGIYANSINFCFFTKDSFKSSYEKYKIFIKYIIDKIENVDKFEDIDLTNCKQDLIQLIEQKGLNPYYEIEEMTEII